MASELYKQDADKAARKLKAIVVLVEVHQTISTKLQIHVTSYYILGLLRIQQFIRSQLYIIGPPR